MAGVDSDGLSWLNWDLLDGTKGVVPYTASAFAACRLNEEHRFAAEEALCTLEFGVCDNIQGRGKVGAALDVEDLAWNEVEALDVTR